jgi:ComF family protein
LQSHRFAHIEPGEPAEGTRVQGPSSRWFGLALELGASFVAPPRCAACDAPVSIFAVFCAPCATLVEPADHSSAGLIAAFLYGGAIARAIVRMKYSNRPDLARPLGHLLLRALEPHAAGLRERANRCGRGGTVVVPVPLHPTRLAERGYNQSALVARQVARGLGAAFCPRALGRSRETSQQTTLDRAERAVNVAGAFFVRAPEQARGRHFVLVDDVRTTGATLDACSGALRRAGAAGVVCAVVARAEGPDRH